MSVAIAAIAGAWSIEQRLTQHISGMIAHRGAAFEPVLYSLMGTCEQTPRSTRRSTSPSSAPEPGSAPGRELCIGHSMMSPHVRRLLWVRGLRAFGDGFVSLLLPLYLIELGLGPFEVGAITAGTLLGSGVLTLVIGLSAHRFRLRTGQFESG